ncbi:MAG TPA: M56 family metallopeptidase, partial [Vicinamibacteria bacterium]
MDDPLRLLLTNAVAAAVLALIAWAASLSVRRASVVHALWLLALVKLVTPPIAPLPLLPSGSPFAFVSRPGPTVVPMPPPETRAGPSRRAEADLVPSSTARRALRSGDFGPVTTPPVPNPGRRKIDGRLATLLALGLGALGILGLTSRRFARFGRLLEDARPAPAAVVHRAAALAARMGLRRPPEVRVLPAGIPPMLWPARGGPLLLLPDRLVPDLHPDELDALLAHELAHVRRRDHWVRLVEIAATALFWWYPLTWWARRALRRAEERCCDEWVLRVLPRSAEAYANGLLKSLAFVADRPLPSVASGAGPVGDIEARLKEILMTRPVPPLAAPLRLALAAAVVLGLAVFPTHA